MAGLPPPGHFYLLPLYGPLRLSSPRKLNSAAYAFQRLLTFSLEPVTGDYSRGAAGYWVEGGRIVHPVHEVTIAGNLREMFRRIVAVGSDRYTVGGKTIGSVIVEGMTVAGS